ncbi:MAG: amidohydrolase family protein [Xanthobacteraceae bacterium]
MTKPKFPEWERDVRAPVPLPPRGSCDCQAHIFGDLAHYPVQPHAAYEPPAASFQDLCRVERTLGFDRFVIVHSMLYGPDHRVTVDALESMPDHSHIRVVGRVDDTTSDKEIERLHALGFRGTRFNFRPDAPRKSWETIMRTADRIRGLGWHFRLHFFRGAVLETSEQLKTIKNIPIVVDHLGYPDPALGANDPTCRWIVERLKDSDNWWVMLSNGNRMSTMESGWDDAVPIARAYIEAAPDRMIWGSDWPHVQWRKQRMMNDGEVVELLYRYVEHDKGLIQKILVDNPARLHGF